MKDVEITLPEDDWYTVINALRRLVERGTVDGPELDAIADAIAQALDS